jgi:hypothetical protein
VRYSCARQRQIPVVETKGDSAIIHTLCVVVVDAKCTDVRHDNKVLFTQAQRIKISETMLSDLAPSAKTFRVSKVGSKLPNRLETLRSVLG